MARTHPIFNNFSAGEWSDSLSGRTDLGKYFNACSRLENMILHPQGGASGRPGTHFVAETKDSTTAVRLISFRFSADQAYIIELGHLYARFYTNSGRIEVAGTPVEIVTPYTEDELFEIHTAQSADTLFLAHPAHPPQQLVRFSHTVWRLQAVTFTPPPSVEYGGRPNATVTPSAVTGAGITLTASAAAFEASDVGREVFITAGASLGARATITGYTDQQHVTATVVYDFADLTAIPAGSWGISESPKTTCAPSAKDPIGAACTLTAGAAAFRNNAGDTDIGKFVRVNGGTVEITGFTNSTTVTGVIRTLLSGTTAAPSESWSLEEAAWNAKTGYPATITWADGRLVFGGTYHQPRTWWESAADDPFNFALGSDDDDAMAWTIDSGDLNAIRWMFQSGRLLIGTAGAEHTAVGGNEGAITPTNVPLRRRASGYGSGTLPPVEADGNLLFLTTSGKKLREMAYRYEIDNYKSPDLALLAEHLTHEKLSHWITDLAYQAEPDGIVWAPRSDGALLGLTYLRDQEVMGWHKHFTDGLFESVAVIPADDATYDQLWCVVRRYINGQWRRYIEYFDPEWDVYDELCPGVHTDSCLTYDGAPATTFAGLGHLEDKTVKVIGDGAVYPDAVVQSGSVTIDGPPASMVEIGLAFTPVLTPMRPDVPIGGTSQGLRKAWGRITVRLKNTMGCVINGEQIPWRSAADPMDAPPPLFTGDKAATMLGWDTDAFVTIEQPQPLPIHVLCITGALVVGD